MNYTFKQYKESYLERLERHKLEYDDHDEFTFIESELESYYESLIYIDGIEEIPFQFQFLKSFTDQELTEALKSQKEFKDFAIKSNLSSSKIIDFLESRKSELTSAPAPVDGSNLENTTDEKFPVELHKKAAVLHHLFEVALKQDPKPSYDEKQAAKIARYYGFDSKTSGQQFLEVYNELKFEHRRTEKPSNKRTLTTMISYYNSVIPLLSQSNKECAISELMELEKLKEEDMRFN